MPRPRTRLLAGIVTVLTLVAVTIVITIDAGESGRKPSATITIRVDGPDLDRRADDKLVVAGPALSTLKKAQNAPQEFDLADNLRGDDTTPEGVIVGPLAAPNWPGCSTRFTPYNFSARRGNIKAFGLHFTGSRNIDGLADMNGLAAYAASRAAGVSWHFLLDREGNCYYQVPVTQKAWTIGNLNSQTINVEMIGNGSEGDYGGTAGIRKLGQIVRRAGSIYGFPVRLGAVDGNCNVTRPGIITHWMGGSCAGGHSDIRPYAIEDAVRKLAGPGVTRTDRVTCRRLNWWRKAGRPRGQARANAIRRRAALAKRNVTCTVKGPVRS